jgi:Integrase core domain
VLLSAVTQNQPFRPPALRERVSANRQSKNQGQGGARAQRATYLPGFGGRKQLTDSYQSVKRFVRKLREAQPERVWRLECQPGEELQLDFGLGALIDDGQGKRRRSWVLRMLLSYSRKGYSEAVTRQDTETFLRCLENGLLNLGGSTLLLNLDNMKAAVLKADWFDPEINPKLADFCRHYGMHVFNPEQNPSPKKNICVEDGRRKYPPGNPEVLVQTCRIRPISDRSPQRAACWSALTQVIRVLGVELGVV